MNHPPPTANILKKPIDPNRHQLADDFYDAFGVKLAYFGTYERGYREDVTIHGIPHRVYHDSDFCRRVRHWLESKGWQFSKQIPSIFGAKANWIFIARLKPISLKIGYHATERRRWAKIRHDGLLPTAKHRQMSVNREDCEGNIYICKRLGKLADAGRLDSQTAHWWRQELWQKSGDIEPLTDWVILRVRLERIKGVQVYRDIFSASRFNIDGVPSIPCENVFDPHKHARRNR